jgi:hypothetical protein
MSIMDMDGCTPVTEKYLVDNGWKKREFIGTFEKVIQCKYIPEDYKGDNPPMNRLVLRAKIHFEGNDANINIWPQIIYSKDRKGAIIESPISVQNINQELLNIITLPSYIVEHYKYLFV